MFGLIELEAEKIGINVAEMSCVQIQSTSRQSGRCLKKAAKGEREKCRLDKTSLRTVSSAAIQPERNLKYECFLLVISAKLFYNL